MGYVITCAVKKSCRPSKGPALTRPPIKWGPWRLPVNSPKARRRGPRELLLAEPECGAPKKLGQKLGQTRTPRRFSRRDWYGRPTLCNVTLPGYFALLGTQWQPARVGCDEGAVLRPRPRNRSQGCESPCCAASKSRPRHGAGRKPKLHFRVIQVIPCTSLFY